MWIKCEQLFPCLWKKGNMAAIPSSAEFNGATNRGQ